MREVSASAPGRSGPRLGFGPLLKSGPLAPYSELMNKSSAMAFLFSCVLCACSSGSGDSPGDGGPACPNVTGTWTVAAHCDASLVGQHATVMQNNCTLSFAPPFDGFTGTVTADGKITLSGPQSCTGTVAAAISLSCTPGTCTVSLTR